MNLTYENLIEKDYVPKIKIKKGNPDLEKYKKKFRCLILFKRKS